MWCLKWCRCRRARSQSRLCCRLSLRLVRAALYPTRPFVDGHPSAPQLVAPEAHPRPATQVHRRGGSQERISSTGIIGVNHRCGGSHDATMFVDVHVVVRQVYRRRGMVVVVRGKDDARRRSAGDCLRSIVWHRRSISLPALRSTLTGGDDRRRRFGTVAVLLSPSTTGIAATFDR